VQEFVPGETGRAATSLDPVSTREVLKTRRAVGSRSFLIWAEHCTECAMPDCYATCSLYTPRPDLKCRRIEGGIQGRELLEAGGTPVPLLEVAFRYWGKLEARGSMSVVNSRAATSLSILDRQLAMAVSVPVVPDGLKPLACKIGNRLREAAVEGAATSARPDAFVMEVINPAEESVDLTFTVKPTGVGATSLFQRVVSARAGYNRILISASAIVERVGEEGDFLFQVEPRMAGLRTPRLTFGFLDFAVLDGAALPSPTTDIALPTTATAPGSSAAGRPKVKCVVWDLDNTLWSGTLIEDGPDKVSLNPRVAATIVELDRRGILNSVASKNSGGVAEEVLKRFGLAEYFLAPQIHWEPKSASLAAVATSLNIGIDSLVFVDDQAFERGEVAHAHPEVETFDVAEVDSLLGNPRFDVPVTEEARGRRLMYKVEESRMGVLRETGGDYAAFLRDCSIKLTISDLGAENLGRVFELTERTNQLNYSGRRLSRSELRALLGAEESVVLVLSVSDRFGDYGLVGAAIIDRASWVLECFFMSCRVQRKKVENAFFAHLRAVGERQRKGELSIVYAPTARNEPSREVLEDQLGFHRSTGERDSTLFHIPFGSSIPDADVVAVVDQSRLGQGAPALVGSW